MERLEQKHSDRSEDIVFNDVDANTPISLKKAIFLEGIKKAPRGCGAEPSVWRYEHLRLLMENQFTTDLLFEVCCLIYCSKRRITIECDTFDCFISFNCTTKRQWKRQTYCNCSNPEAIDS